MAAEMTVMVEVEVWVWVQVEVLQVTDAVVTTAVEVDVEVAVRMTAETGDEWVIEEQEISMRFIVNQFRQFVTIT